VSGTYTFYTTADDGVRLWVNGQLLIDRWSDRPTLLGDVNDDGTVNFVDYQILERQFGTTNPQSDLNGDGIVSGADFTLLYNNLGKTLAGTTPVNSGAISLQAGVKYDIRLEYYQSGGSASAKLEWITPVLGRRTIPTDQLFLPPPPPPPPPVPAAPAVSAPVRKAVIRAVRPSRPEFCTRRVHKPDGVPQVTTFIPAKKAPVAKKTPLAKLRH
jgi:hypothetical protein